MPLALVIPVVLLLVLCLASVAFHALLLVRIASSSRASPRVKAGLASAIPEPAPCVCVIVPAHNEQGVIGILARSLMRQTYPRMSIVFSLDRCTDETEQVLRRELDAGAAARREAGDADIPCEILSIADCPADWAGKVHAIHRAVVDSGSAREADLLLFADADTEFHPDCIRAAVGLLHERKLDLLSLLSTLTIRQWFEKVVQPAAAMELIRQYPLDRVNRPRRPRPFANGQFILVRRGPYEEVGGHAALKQFLLEDIALARRLVRKSRGRRIGVFLAGDMLRCRMYADAKAFRRGWKRIYTESTRRMPRRLTKAAWRLRLTGVVLLLVPWVGMAAGAAVLSAHPGDPLGVALLASGGMAALLAVPAIIWVYAMQGAPVYLAALYPIGAWIVSDILAEAAADLQRGTPTRWAGREYNLSVKR